MNQYTKGPWSQGRRGPNGCPIIGNGRGLMVAMLAHSANESGQEIEAEANANLIAAAPELLEADQRYLEFRHTGDIGMGYQFSGIHPQAQLKAAIAKARGAQ